MTLLEKVRYAEIYSFLFSPRRGTAAAELRTTLPRRSNRLASTACSPCRTRSVGRAGTGPRQVRSVLVEGASKQGQGQLFGRTTWNRIVNFSGPSELIGQLVPVRVTRSYRNSQLGSWLSKMVIVDICSICPKTPRQQAKH